MFPSLPRDPRIRNTGYNVSTTHHFGVGPKSQVLGAVRWYVKGSLCLHSLLSFSTSVLPGVVVSRIESRLVRPLSLSR